MRTLVIALFVIVVVVALLVGSRETYDSCTDKGYVYKRFGPLPGHGKSVVKCCPNNNSAESDCS